MIKRILLPLDPTAFTECAAEFAISLAKIYNAEVTGLVILDLPGIAASTGPLPPGVGFYAKELENSKVEAAKVHIKILLSKYKKIFEDQGIKFIEGNSQGSPSERIGEMANYHDIVITGLRNNYHFETSDAIENSLSGVINNCVTPIIAVPDKMSKFFTDRQEFKVFIAYNGSIASARAMQRFAQTELSKPTEVTIFVSNEDKEIAETLFVQAQYYLNAHGYTHIHKLVTHRDKIKIWDKTHLDTADIIVLGAHSKNGFFDFLSGSLAKHLINENDTMLFISQ